MGPKLRRCGLAAAAALVLAGCVSVPADNTTPSFETLRLLRERGIPMVGIGSFVPRNRSIGRSVVIRGSTMHPPKGSDYGAFLGSVFESELKAAGKLDTSAPARITGILTESQAKEDFANGKASLGAEIAIMREGRAIFTRSYRVESTWKSDFIGALAIPEAFRQYNALYAVLVRQVFTDPDFIAALKS